MIEGVCPWCRGVVRVPVRREMRTGVLVVFWPSVRDVERAVFGHECQN